MRGVPAREGCPAHGIPTPLDPVHGKERHEPGPLPPLRAGTPLPVGTTPPPHRLLFGKAERTKGPGLWLSWTVGGSDVGTPRPVTPLEPEDPFPGHLTRSRAHYFACSPEEFCEYFVRVCLGILHWKMAGIFGEFFLVSVSHETKHEKSSKNSGENSEQNSAQNSGGKFEKFGKLSFCNFSNLKKNKPQRSPPHPSPLPAGPPEPTQKKGNSRPRTPSKSIPQKSPRAPSRWGTCGGPFFGSIHFLTRACLLSRRMTWVASPDIPFASKLQQNWSPKQFSRTCFFTWIYTLYIYNFTYLILIFKSHVLYT